MHMHMLNIPNACTSKAAGCILLHTTDLALPFVQVHRVIGSCHRLLTHLLLTQFLVSITVLFHQTRCVCQCGHLLHIHWRAHTLRMKNALRVRAIRPPQAHTSVPLAIRGVPVKVPHFILSCFLVLQAQRFRWSRPDLILQSRAHLCESEACLPAALSSWHVVPPQVAFMQPEMAMFRG